MKRIFFFRSCAECTIQFLNFVPFQQKLILEGEREQRRSSSTCFYFLLEGHIEPLFFSFSPPFRLDFVTYLIRLQSDCGSKKRSRKKKSNSN